MTRFTQINPPESLRFLVPGDQCVYLGEYTAHGGYRASDTNQQIYNLKHRPTSSQGMLYWKTRAIEYWGRMLAGTNLKWDYCLNNVTFVPIPCSKPVGHVEYDDRMLRVLNFMAGIRPGLDIRQVLLQAAERAPQHAGQRMMPAEIQQYLQIDGGTLVQPLKETVIVVDDVITRGASFAAAKQMLTGLPNVQQVVGFFLAKTVHPPVAFDELVVEDFL